MNSNQVIVKGSKDTATILFPQVWINNNKQRYDRLSCKLMQLGCSSIFEGQLSGFKLQSKHSCAKTILNDLYKYIV